MDNKNKKIILIVIILIALVGITLGVTYAFFNYTRTGLANTIRVGRIYFNHEEGNAINLTNVFPIDSTQAETDTTNAKTLSITVTGDTDYEKGIEYLLTLDQINNTVNNKKVPIALEVSVSGNGLGTAETEDYYANRENYSVSKYKIEYNDKFEEERHLLVGYIAPNTTSGTIEGIEGTINIKAYLDKDKVAITDTYPEEHYEGYILNSNMNINNCVSVFNEFWGPEEDVDLDEGETYESACEGTGTLWGLKFQEILDMGEEGFDQQSLDFFEENNIIKHYSYTDGTTSDWVNGRIVLTTEEWNSLQTNPLSFKVKVEANEGIWVEHETTPKRCFTTTAGTISYLLNNNMRTSEINTCVSYLTSEWGPEEEGNTVDVGETYESFCSGTGTNWNDTFQFLLDENGWDDNQLSFFEENNIINKEYVTIITNYDETCGTDVIIPNKLPVEKYVHNSNMITSEINACVSYLTSEFGPEEERNNSDETYESFCEGTGTLDGDTFQQWLDSDFYPTSQLIHLEENNIILRRLFNASVTTIGINAFDNKDLTSVEIPNSVTLIEEGAFFHNSQIQYIKVPDAYFELNSSEICRKDSLVELSNNNINDIGVLGLYYQHNDTNFNFKKNIELYRINNSSQNIFSPLVKIINHSENKYCFAAETK